MDECALYHECAKNNFLKKSCKHSRNVYDLLGILEEEAEALKEAIEMFEELSFKDGVLSSELFAIQETKCYLKRRFQLVSNMMQLLQCVDER